MTNEEALQYIIPFVKSMKVRVINDRTVELLLLNNILICTDSESGCLYVVNNLADTGTILAGFYSDLFENPNNINYRVYQELIEYYNRYTNINNWYIERSELEYDETFMNMVASKSGSGLHKYNLEDMVVLPIFYGLVPANKGDKINVAIATIDESTIVVRYGLYKKKLKNTIYIYNKLLKIW